MNLLMKILKNLVRVGEVSDIDYSKGRVKIVFRDKDEIVTPFLPMLSLEYNMPKINDSVLCLFLGNGIQKGFCIGPYYSEKNKPSVTGSNIYYKDFFGEAFLKYDKDTHTLTLSAQNVSIEGDLSVDGNIGCTGSIAASGTVTGSNIP